MSENVLLPNEIEFFISSLKESTIEDIGSIYWIDWHMRLQKLNQQAVLEATEIREESVKECFISCNKVGALVYEAIVMSVWRIRIFPRLLKLQPEPEHTFLLYAALYHEATAVSLLEMISYHSDSCRILDDTAIDLLDYVYDAMTKLIPLKRNMKEDMDLDEAMTNLEQIYRDEIPRQRDTLLFDIGMRSISIIFHLIANIDSLLPGVLNRMLTTLDVPLLMVQLIEEKPWIKKSAKFGTQHYIEGKWQKVSGEAELKLTGQEAHIWLSLRQLLIDPKNASIYEFNDFRKSQLIRLQKYLNEIIMDQIPPLIELKQWLCQMSITESTGGKKAIILEVIPEIKQNILKYVSSNIKSLTRTHAARFFTKNQEELTDIANRLNEAFNTDFLEKMEKQNSENICAGCGRSGTKKCSKCKSEWYCGRECQVRHWPQHKEKCLAKENE